MLSRLRVDPFILALLAAVALASVLPVRGAAAAWFGQATNLAVALLFFLHGARLSRSTVIAGATHWRLHLVILASTYLVFPLLGLGIDAVAGPWLSPALAAGVLFLCVLPSTVQSSIAFTSIAGGNVPAAVCAASASNIVGMVLTPLLVGLVLHGAGGHGPGFSADVLLTIFTQLLLPFALGQALQPFIGGWVGRHKPILSLVDRGSILMVVYGAFSAAVVEGLWHEFTPTALATMALVDMVLLALVLAVTSLGSRWLGFAREDRIAIVFCGSKKSLASGVPMARVIFAGQGGYDVGSIVLPLMLFHQIQLMACAALARRYAAQAGRVAPPLPVVEREGEAQPL